MVGDRKVVFCGTQRTGSAMIYDDMFNLAGGHEPNAEILYSLLIRERKCEDWASAWTTIENKNCVQNVVAVKVMWHYTPYIAGFIKGIAVPKPTPPVMCFDPERVAPFFEFFRDAVWAHLEREDVCAQATSLYLAQQTQIWENRDANAKPTPSTMGGVAYDRPRLMQIVENVLAERALWRQFFDYFDISPISITYEQAAVGYPRYLDELFAVAELKPLSPPPPRRMFKVGTAKNVEFARLLRDDLAAQL